MTQEEINEKLILALQRGRFNDARSALDAGADVNASDEFARTPLHFVAGYHYSQIPAAAYTEFARLLVEKGADVNAQGSQGSTALHSAAGGGYNEIAQLLIDSGAEVNARDERGRTPLHSAAESGHVDTGRLLVKSGADVDTKDKEGRTPQDLAAARQTDYIVQAFASTAKECGHADDIASQRNSGRAKTISP